MMQPRLIAFLSVALVFGQGCALYKKTSIDDEVRASLPEPLDKEPIAGLTNPRFNAEEAMIASAELMRSADAFYERFQDMGWLDDARQVHYDTLLEVGPAYSRYNVDHFLLFSGSGVPLVESPHFNATINQRLLLRAGLEEYPIPDLRPLFLEYASADPHFVTVPDFGTGEGDPPEASTLRWNEAWFERDLVPATLGAALSVQVLWARRFLWQRPGGDETEPPSSDAASPGDPESEDPAPEDPFLLEEDPFTAPDRTEVSPEDRFFGLLLADMAANKIIALATELALDEEDDSLGSLPPGYGPGAWEDEPLRYYPHRLRETAWFVPQDEEEPEEPPAGRYYVVDAKSHLRDQALLLEGLLEFDELADPERFSAVYPLFPRIDSRMASENPIFTDRVPIFARRIANAVVRTILDLHHREADGMLVSFALPGRQGKTVRTVDLGMALVALDRYARQTWADPVLRERVLGVIRQAGSFLVRYQYRDGAFADWIEVRDGDAAEPHGFHLTSQTYAIRGMLTAYRTTGDFRLRQAAWRTYLFLEKELWAPSHDLYRVEDLVAQGQKQNHFTPLVLASTISGLRELALGTRDFAVVERMVDFMNGIETSGLQMSELAPTGEVPSAVDEEGVFDADEDGILKPQFAGGRFGIAPVFASEVLVHIPSTGDIIPPAR